MTPHPGESVSTGRHTHTPKSYYGVISSGCSEEETTKCRTVVAAESHTVLPGVAIYPARGLTKAHLLGPDYEVLG